MSTVPLVPESSPNPLPLVAHGRSRAFWAGALVTLLGAATRFWDLSRLSLWGDEVVTWRRAGLPIAELVEDAIRRLHSPAYFLLMKPWLALGDDEWMLRAPSAFFGTLKVLCCFALGWTAGGLRTAVAAAVLVSLVPVQLHYDQEARMYALQGLGIALSLCGLTWLAVHPTASALRLWPSAVQAHVADDLAMRRAARRAFVVFVVGMVFAIHTHNGTIFYMATAGVAAVLVSMASGSPWRALGNVALAFGLVAATLVPRLAPLWGQAVQVHRRFWATFPTWHEFTDVTQDLYSFGVFGRNHDWRLLPIVLLLAALIVLRRQPLRLAYLLVMTALPPALVLLVSLERPMFLLRMLAWVAIPACLLMAHALASLRGRASFGLALSCVIGVGLWQLRSGYFSTRSKPQWREAIATVADAYSPGTLVILAGKQEEKVLSYYFERHTNPLPRWPAFRVADDASFARLPKFGAPLRAVVVLYHRKGEFTDRVIDAVRARMRQRFNRHFGHSLHVRAFEPRARTRR